MCTVLEECDMQTQMSPVENAMKQQDHASPPVVRAMVEDLELGPDKGRLEISHTNEDSSTGTEPPHGAPVFEAMENRPPAWFRPWVLLLGCCYIYLLIFLDRGAQR